MNLSVQQRPHVIRFPFFGYFFTIFKFLKNSKITNSKICYISNFKAQFYNSNFNQKREKIFNLNLATFCANRAENDWLSGRHFTSNSRFEAVLEELLRQCSYWSNGNATSIKQCVKENWSLVEENLKPRKCLVFVPNILYSKIIPLFAKNIQSYAAILFSFNESLLNRQQTALTTIPQYVFVMELNFNPHNLIVFIHAVCDQ